LQNCICRSKTPFNAIKDERCPVEGASIKAAATAEAELTSTMAEKKCIVAARSNYDVGI